VYFALDSSIFLSRMYSAICLGKVHQIYMNVIDLGMGYPYVYCHLEDLDREE
jgi:hypothetical protein